MRSEVQTSHEALDAEVIVDYGINLPATDDFQIHSNPAVLRAFGLTEGQSAEVWMTIPNQGDAEAQFLLNGKALTLTPTNTAVVIPLPGVYFLKLFGTSGNCKIVRQHTELARHTKQVSMGTGTGLTPAQQAQLAKAHDRNTDTQLVDSDGNPLTADEIREGIDDGFAAVAAEPIEQGQPVYVRRLNGQLMRAHSGTQEASTIAGFAAADIAVGASGRVRRNTQEQTNWTAVSGTPALSPNFQYWLTASPGQISRDAPQSSGVFMAAVGRAETVSRIKITLQPSILL